MQPRLPARPRTSVRAARAAVTGHIGNRLEAPPVPNATSRACARIADPSAVAAARQFSGSPGRPGSAGMLRSLRRPFVWSLLGRRRPRAIAQPAACSAPHDVALHLVLDRPASRAALLLVHRGRSDKGEDRRSRDARVSSEATAWLAWEETAALPQRHHWGTACSCAASRGSCRRTPSSSSRPAFAGAHAAPSCCLRVLSTSASPTVPLASCVCRARMLSSTKH